jgi:hypothetical protein
MFGILDTLLFVLMFTLPTRGHGWADGAIQGSWSQFHVAAMVTWSVERDSSVAFVSKLNPPDTWITGVPELQTRSYL